MSRELFQRGDRIGDYEIVGRLRAGGMATLFLGRRHGAAGLSKPVVIKVIHPHLAEDDLIIKMFIDEARISSHIAHGNVVYIEKFGEFEGVYYMVMEYVDGCSLDQVLRGMWQRRERMAPAFAAHIAMEVAAGLHAAHETCDEEGAPLNIVHRDVSPSNVLITKSGHVKVIDFGIAKARGRLGATKSGHSLKGKIRYMSPEQAWGKEIDRRTDVYAVGIVLWELLACKQLFREDDDFRLLELVRNPTIPPVGAINTDVTVALEEVLARATAKDVADRLATANDLRRELMKAVPEAMTIANEELGKLVAQTRATLGLQSLDSAEFRLTPSKPMEAQLGPETIVIESGSKAGSDSLSRGNGELTPSPQPALRKRWGLIGIAGGIAVALALVLVVALRGGNGDDDKTSSPAAKPTPAPVKPVDPPPADAAVAMTPDAAPVEPIDAGGVVAKPQPKPKQPVAKRPTPPTGTMNNGVEIDGMLLADPNAQKPKPKPQQPKPKPKSPDVNVDGTPLAP